jgi:subtilisin-like proprotein convertase family protein
MTSARARLALLGILALTMGLIPAGAASAKKKGKAGGTATITKNVNAAIPDQLAVSPFTDGQLQSAITVGGKKFKGTRIHDVNATFQTTGNSPDAAGDLIILLTGPNGSTTTLFNASDGGRSVGPLTLDDESVNAIQFAATPGPSPPPRDSTMLADPWIGTAQPYCYQAVGGCPLALLDNGPASGTWTLTALDQGSAAGDTSTLNFWRLQITAGKPYRTK